MSSLTPRTVIFPQMRARACCSPSRESVKFVPPPATVEVLHLRKGLNVDLMLTAQSKVINRGQFKTILDTETRTEPGTAFLRLATGEPLEENSVAHAHSCPLKMSSGLMLCHAIHVCWASSAL